MQTYKINVADDDSGEFDVAESLSISTERGEEIEGIVDEVVFSGGEWPSVFENVLNLAQPKDVMEAFFVGQLVGEYMEKLGNKG
jgi:hypothetical protein